MQSLRLSPAQFMHLLLALMALFGGRFPVLGQTTISVVTPGEFTAADYNISCVVCDSYTDSEHCAEWDGLLNVRQCSLEQGIRLDKPMSCRKIVQTVYKETRVVRQCSNLVGERELTCIDRVGTDKIKMRYCHCRGSNCNGATMATMPAAAVSMGLAIAVVQLMGWTLPHS